MDGDVLPNPINLDSVKNTMLKKTKKTRKNKKKNKTKTKQNKKTKIG